MSAKDHWACEAEQHPRYRAGEHGLRIGCSVTAGHNPSAAPRDCYTCKQAASKSHRGETKQQADRLHFDCSLMPWEHDPPNQIGSMGGHRVGCAVLPGHVAAPGKKCPQCRRRYSGYEGLSPTETLDHPHYACSIPVLDHAIKPRVGRGHRPGCQVAEGHTPGGVRACRQCSIDREGEDFGRNRAIKTKYRLSREDYEVLLVQQGGACAICQSPPVRGHLHVDHDHGTSRVRGLLCKTCNLLLGLARDDPTLLESAQKYLATRK